MFMSFSRMTNNKEFPGLNEKFDKTKNILIKECKQTKNE